jgi:hypothetical protein
MGKSAESTFCNFCFPSSHSHFCPADECIVSKRIVQPSDRGVLRSVVNLCHDPKNPHENSGDSG